MESSMRTIDTDLQDCDSNECKLPKKHEGLCDHHISVLTDYTNWKGERRKRRLFPTGMVKFDATQFHEAPQWLCEAIDAEDGKRKLFAMKDFHGREQLEASIRMRWYRG